MVVVLCAKEFYIICIFRQLCLIIFGMFYLVQYCAVTYYLHTPIDDLHLNFSAFLGCVCFPPFLGVCANWLTRKNPFTGSFSLGRRILFHCPFWIWDTSYFLNELQNPCPIHCLEHPSQIFLDCHYLTLSSFYCLSCLNSNTDT